MEKTKVDILNRLNINVRGQMFQIEDSLSKKIPHGLLATLDANHSNYVIGEKCYFFNRDPVLFNCILNYYVNGVLHVPATMCPCHVMTELHFWGLGKDDLADCCYGRITEMTETALCIMNLRQSFERGSVNSKVSTSGENCETSGPLTIRDRIYFTLEYPSYSRCAKVYAIAQYSILVLSILAMIAFSDLRVRLPNKDAKTLREEMEAANLTEAYRQLYILSHGRPSLSFEIIEYVTVGLMTIDLLVRVGTCRNRKELMSVYTLFDVLAIVPPCVMVGYYFGAIDNFNIEVTSYKMIILDALVGLRVLRVLRLLKVLKQVKVLQVMVLALKASRKELLLLMGLVSILATIFGCFVYKLEMFENTFESMGHGIWWSVVTMTTLGYGDYYPKGAFGCILGSLAALSGILLLALPIPVIANNFDKYYSMFYLMKLMTERGNNDVFVKESETKLENRKDEEKEGNLYIQDIDTSY